MIIVRRFTFVLNFHLNTKKYLYVVLVKSLINKNQNCIKTINFSAEIAKGSSLGNYIRPNQY